jgi:hypothetical protein
MNEWIQHDAVLTMGPGIGAEKEPEGGPALENESSRGLA